MEHILDGVWVVLGAGIATLTTWLFSKSAEYETRRRMAFSLFIKSFRAVNDMMRLHRDLNGQIANFEKNEGRRPTEQELWSAITPFLGLPSDTIEFTGQELAVFENDGGSIGKLLEFLDARQVLFDTVRAYNEKRTKLTNSLSMLSTFSSKGALKAESAFDIRDRPDLHKEVLEITHLAKDMVESVARAETAARRICDLINLELPKRFKARDFKLRMELPRADA